MAVDSRRKRFESLIIDNYIWKSSLDSFVRSASSDAHSLHSFVWKLYLVIFPAFGCPDRVSVADALACLDESRKTSQTILDLEVPQTEFPELCFAEIDRDIPRLLQDREFFQNKDNCMKVKPVLQKISIFYQRKYRQGCHELYGHIFHEFSSEQTETSSTDHPFDLFFGARFVEQDTLAVYLGLLNWLDYFFAEDTPFPIPDFLKTIDPAYAVQIWQFYQNSMSTRYYQVLFLTVFHHPDEVNILWSRIFLCYPNPAILDRLLVALYSAVKEAFFQAEPDLQFDVFQMKSTIPSLVDVLTIAMRMKFDDGFWSDNPHGWGKETFEEICRERCQNMVKWQLTRLLTKWDNTEQLELANSLKFSQQVALNELPEFWEKGGNGA
jgi:hypothetical protein